MSKTLSHPWPKALQSLLQIHTASQNLCIMHTAVSYPTCRDPSPLPKLRQATTENLQGIRIHHCYKLHPGIAIVLPERLSTSRTMPRDSRNGLLGPRLEKYFCRRTDPWHWPSSASAARAASVQKQENQLDRSLHSDQWPFSRHPTLPSRWKGNCSAALSVHLGLLRKQDRMAQPRAGVSHCLSFLREIGFHLYIHIHSIEIEMWSAKRRTWSPTPTRICIVHGSRVLAPLLVQKCQVNTSPGVTTLGFKAYEVSKIISNRMNPNHTDFAPARKASCFNSA